MCSSDLKRGPLFITVRGPLTTAASLLAEHRLQTRTLSNCGSRAQPLRGTWDPPRPGPEPAPPAPAGRLSTTAPPGKPPTSLSILESHPLPCDFVVSFAIEALPSIFESGFCCVICFGRLNEGLCQNSGPIPSLCLRRP